MGNFYSDNADIQFYFERGVDWSDLIALTERGYSDPDGFSNEADARAFYREVLAISGDIAANVIASRAARIDREDSHLENGEAIEGSAMREIFDAIRGAELHGLPVPRELGGMNAPMLVYFLSAEMIARGDVSVMTHHSFHGGMAMAMLVYSLREKSTVLDLAKKSIESTRFADEIREIVRGEAWGCMDITEPNAGSDMAALRTVAEQDADGTWRVTGQKIFITSGHGKYHFVIARTEKSDPDSTDSMAGLKGLSMFLVKAYDDDAEGNRTRYVTIDRVEEKLGHHGSVTASLNFDRAKAQLIGQRGEGFAYMLVLMNNARVGVGFEGIGLAECALRMAEEYAEGRRSMGKAIARHEMIADMLDEMKTDIQGLRALAVASGFHEEMAQKLGLFEKMMPITGRKIASAASHLRRSRRFTPLLKYWSSEKAVEIARRAVQIHGGVGYTKDYGAEKLLRDAMVLPIYEGTSQIQSLMVMKDSLLGIAKSPQRFVKRLAQARLLSSTSRDPLERRVAKIQVLALSAQQFLLAKTAMGKIRTLRTVPLSGWKQAMTTGWDPKRDFSLAMLHAERLTKLLADEAIVELLLDQAKKFPERRELLERYLDRAEIRDRALYEEITTTGTRLLERLAVPATPSRTPTSQAAE